jgi:hypothetical protein
MQPRLVAIAACLLLLASPAAAGPPAAIPEDDIQKRTLDSFHGFASRWMEKLERVETRNREQPQVHSQGSRTMVTYRGYGPDFEIEVKHTGYAPAPFVGVLRYSEQIFTCVDSRATRCRLASTTPVTEIFRFQNGRWVY